MSLNPAFEHSFQSRVRSCPIQSCHQTKHRLGVTYTSISSDYEEPYDVGSLGVVVYGYDGLIMHLINPPSLDYVPGPEEPEQAPLSPDYMPGQEYPEYLASSDEEVPIEDQPY
nr:hypothetical protein [Tanacetum cinerariifolium]